MMDTSSSVRSVDGSQDDEDWSRNSRPFGTSEVLASGFAAVQEVADEQQEEKAEEEEAFVLPPLPRRTEPTLKERLVERERQARVETERARLKRQFALSSNGGAADQEEAGMGDDDDLHATREHGSVAGTVGEDSTVAAHHAEEEEEEGRQGTTDAEPLGYAMERFLADRTELDAEATPTLKDDSTPETGVIMERFLADPVVVDSTVLPVQGVSNDDDEVGMVVAGDEVRDVAHESAHQENHSSSSSFASDFIGRHEETDRAVQVTETTQVEPIEATENQDDNSLHDIPVRGRRDSDLNATMGSIRSYSTASEGDVVLDSSLALAVSSDVNPPSLETESNHVGGPSLQSLESQDGSHLEDSAEMITTTTPSQDQGSTTDETPPRVFRLTEAEIQEMAAIEEASIGNAPPSERDFSESSLVGDMVRDFGGGSVGGDLDRQGASSERTQTTALESVSVTENQSAVQPTTRSDGDSINDMAASVSSSHLALSTGAGSDGSIASVTAMPPSVTEEEPHDVVDHPHASSIPDEEIVRQGNDLFLELDSPVRVPNPPTGTIPSPQQLVDAVDSAAQNPGIVNRTLNPGRVRRGSAGQRSLEGDGSAMKRSSSLPLIVDGFDFDKYNPDIMSPLQNGGGDSYGDLPGDELWSPSGKVSLSPAGKMTLSPLRLPSTSEDKKYFNIKTSHEPHQTNGNAYFSSRPGDEERAVFQEKAARGGLKDYGTAATQEALQHLRHPPLFHLKMDRDEAHLNDVVDDSERNDNERMPLMQVPRTVELRPQESPRPRRHSSLRTLDDMVDSVFSSVRSVSTATVEAEVNESDAYLASSMLARAFPERFFALMVTLLVEVPTVMMISGGSDRLCMLIGRSRYQLMMAFLPLSSAISGNVGLQASTLTTRAISHRHVTRNDYRKWFFREVGAAAYLGFGMGIVIGSVAYVASGMDFGFGFTIFMAQQVSILTAGFTGTFAPLLFSFIFHRDSGKWGGPLETAVQDIVGSFAMVIMSYRLLILLGPVEVDPNDVCGVEV